MFNQFSTPVIVHSEEEFRERMKRDTKYVGKIHASVPTVYPVMVIGEMFVNSELTEYICLEKADVEEIIALSEEMK